MRYPAFFDEVPRIALRDPLAEFLGALEGGLVEFSYLDAVRLAGHSCPTVASAYGITRRALAALYGDALPERGAQRLSFREPIGEGVTGVIANVISMLTGAAHDGGFKGIAGRFFRRDLLAFGAEQPLALRFARIDTGASVDAEADIKRVPSDPRLPALLARAAAGEAGADELRRFGELWQDRVRRLLLEHGDDPEVFRIRPRA
ncbi:MAG: hypothetical protein L6Q72_01555 [Burkholderiaceae bacterium]|nr:hypothetical protein [Burkholderiaceae bacterium]